MSRLVHVLLLQLLMPFTEPVLDVFVEAEHDAVLRCDKVQEEQKLCNMTAWLYNNPKTSNPAVELITLGKIHSDFRFKDRFSLTESCSLVIKNVQIQDGLHFSCKQYDRGGKELSDASTILTVVLVVEHETGPTCYVSSPHRCSDFQVRWFYNDSEIRDSSISNTEFRCGATLVYQPSDYRQTKRDLFKCEITHNNKRHVYKLKPAVTTDRASESGCDRSEAAADTGHWIKNLLLIVGLAALLLSLAVGHLYARVKGRVPASKRSRTNVNTGGAVRDSVAYENVPEPSVNVRFHSLSEN